MARAKGLFKFVWYLWNIRSLGQVLFVFLFGLVFLFGAAYYGSRDRLPETPESVDLATVHQLIEASDPRYIRLAAKPDYSRRIYRSGVWAPFWGNCSPDEIHEMDSETFGAEDLKALLGCRVEARARAGIGDARTVRWPPLGTGETVMTVSLTPLKGAKGKVWVRSDVVKGPIVDIRSWQMQERFSGVLATFAQAWR